MSVGWRITCGHPDCFEKLEAPTAHELIAKRRELGWQSLTMGQFCPALLRVATSMLGDPDKLNGVCRTSKQTLVGTWAVRDVEFMELER